MSEDKKAAQIVVLGDGNNVALGNITLKIEKVSSLMAKISPKLLEIALQVELVNSGTKKEFKFDEKISHNQLKAYKAWVEKYGEYGHLIDAVYESLDNNTPSTKARIMIAIAQYYTGEKVQFFADNKLKNYPTEIDCIRDNADIIFERVISKIKSEISSGKVDQTLNLEDIQICSTIIACHGFIHCKILEKPPGM